jgi:hypothetical protein
MDDFLEDMTRMFRERLFSAFFDWLDVNKEAIGDKWYEDLYTKGRDGEADCNTVGKLIGTMMWMFNGIANVGVMAGVGPNHFDLQYLANPKLDRPSTVRLLALMSSTLALQGLPAEIRNHEIPIISSKKFSLKLYAQTR